MEQILIQIPEGHVIDTEQSNLEEGKIVFKKKEVTPWKECAHLLTGYCIIPDSNIIQIDKKDMCFNDAINRNVFASKKQAQSMLAMAQLSQIIQNDERFGGPITDEEWEDSSIQKYVIIRIKGEIKCSWFTTFYYFLAFHTVEQRDLFLKENEDLIRQYYMLD